RLDRSGEQALNPFDAHAIEEALRLKEGPAGQDSEVVVVCMGRDGAMRSLHKALSLGADRAVLVTDPSLAGAGLNPTAARRALAPQRAPPRLTRRPAARAGSPAPAGAAADAAARPRVPRGQDVPAEGKKGPLSAQRGAGPQSQALPPPNELPHPATPPTA